MPFSNSVQVDPSLLHGLSQRAPSGAVPKNRSDCRIDSQGARFLRPTAAYPHSPPPPPPPSLCLWQLVSCSHGVEPLASRPTYSFGTGGARPAPSRPAQKPASREGEGGASEIEACRSALHLVRLIKTDCRLDCLPGMPGFQGMPRAPLPPAFRPRTLV
jgi:hypothetical protein